MEEAEMTKMAESVKEAIYDLKESEHKHYHKLKNKIEEGKQVMTDTVYAPDNTAALIAAMNSGNGANQLAPLLASMNGGGLGGNNGLLGILALGLLARNGGIFGGNNNDGVSGLNNLQGSIDSNAIMQQLADIKASVPYNESQMQLALAGAQSDITQQMQTATTAIQGQQFQSQIANTQGFANTKDAVDGLSTQVAVGQGVTNTNIERLGWQLQTAINNDGDKTRALITNNQIADLQRQLTVSQNEAFELRSEGARAADRQAIEINMINNQNQNQLQFQQQQQQLGQLTNALLSLSQIATATNQAINIGSGAQTANPYNSATNVRA